MKPILTGDAMNLIFDVKEDVATIPLNRPQRRNALSRQLLSELETTLARIATDPKIRVVIVAANGSVFCSGHDLSEMIGCSEECYRDLFTQCSRVMLQLRRLPQPVIARVQGMATAAGCQLVAGCDLAGAPEKAPSATPTLKTALSLTPPLSP